LGDLTGLLLLVVGGLQCIEGVIAVGRGYDSALTRSQMIALDISRWGWLTSILGAAIIFAGWSLIAAASWARPFAIVVTVLGTLGQLAFVRSLPHPLWPLTIATTGIVAVVALIVHRPAEPATSKPSRRRDAPERRR
jgi:hypothetical protein